MFFLATILNQAGDLLSCLVHEKYRELDQLKASNKEKENIYFSKSKINLKNWEF